MGKLFRKVKPQDRDGVGFATIPHVVLQSRNFIALSANAKALLLEVALQVEQPSTDNNGMLMISRSHLVNRGWNSVDMLTKGKRELLDGGFIFETVKGQRPNKASWYAVTWHPLAKLEGYDAGVEKLFRRAAYKDGDLLKPKPTRQELYDKWKEPAKNASLTPSHGAGDALIAPSHGVEGVAVAPSHGAISPTFGGAPRPQDGHHLDIAIYRGSSIDASDKGSVEPVPIQPPVAAKAKVPHQPTKTASGRKNGHHPTLRPPKGQKSTQNGEKTLAHDDDPLSAYW